MQESIENGSGHHVVAEDVAPLRDGLVGGDEHTAALVASADELEEEVCGGFLQGQVTELIDD